MATLSLGPYDLHGPQILGCLLSVHLQTFASPQSIGMCVLLEGYPHTLTCTLSFCLCRAEGARELVPLVSALLSKSQWKALPFSFFGTL